MPETDSDTGADTARFQAFKDRERRPSARLADEGPGSKIGMLAGIVVVVAIFAAIFGVLLVG